MWMTQNTFVALEHERDELASSRRELTQQEQVRLLELRQLIDRADVSEKPDDGLVEPGMKIVVRFADGESDSFVLSDQPIADGQVVSLESPLGRAINGTRVGDAVPYSTPTGRTQSVTIVGATPYVSN